MPKLRYLVMQGCLLGSLLLSGCTDQRILEDLGFSHTTTYDLAPEDGDNPENRNGLLISVAIPKANADGKVKRETLTTLAKTSKEARNLLAKQTELTLVSGQLRNTLFGSELARQGVWDILDALNRDPSISQRVRISVVNGSAHNLLLHEYPQHPRTGQYVDRLLEKESNRQTIPRVTLHTFVRDLLDDGIDPVAPLILEGESNVILDGIALFRGERYVERIPPEDTLFFSMIRGDFKQGDITVDLGPNEKDKQEHITLNSLVNDRKVLVTPLEDQRFQVKVQLSIKGSVLEYDGDRDFAKKEELHQMEQEISQYVTRKAGKVMALLQANKTDSLGIGIEVRNTLPYAEWKQLDWTSVYPKVDIELQIGIEINNVGMFR